MSRVPLWVAHFATKCFPQIAFRVTLCQFMNCMSVSVAEVLLHVVPDRQTLYQVQSRCQEAIPTSTHGSSLRLDLPLPSPY